MQNIVYAQDIYVIILKRGRRSNCSQFSGWSDSAEANKIDLFCSTNLNTKLLSVFVVRKLKDFK